MIPTTATVKAVRKREGGSGTGEGVRIGELKG